MEVIERKKVERKDILNVEEALKNVPEVIFGDNAMCPVTHSFSDGIYVREIFIPKGTILTGKIHKHDHPNFLMKGIVNVVTEHGGIERLEAPLSMISKAGTKRVVQALTDVVWITCHVNVTNTHDLDEIEEFVIADSYENFDKFIADKERKKISLKNRILGLLNIKL